MSSPNQPRSPGGREVTADVRLANGKRLSAAIQCSEHSARHHGHERVKDVLNDDGALIRMWDEAVGAWVLVNKGFIELVELQTPDLAEESTLDLTEHRPVSVLLGSGRQVQGSLLVSSPKEQSETLDFLNRGERFFYLVGQHGTRIVNVAHVIVVSELDEAE